MVSKTKNKKIRVAKLISNSGFTSRRSAERLILDKKVTLNGKPISVVEEILGGEPSKIFNNACWTPSPETSLVMDVDSDFLEILSNSSI